jgi:hypothetical protein
VTEEEAVALARYVHALCPQQRFDEYTPDVWGDVLADYEFADCKQAAIEIARRQPWIAPAEIIAEVKRARTRRLDYFQYEPEPDETSRQFTLRLRDQIADVVNGQRRPELPYAGSLRPIAELTAGRTVPDAWETTTTTRVHSAYAVRCPHCGADPRRPCHAPSGRRLDGYHGSRMDAAKEAA